MKVPYLREYKLHIRNATKRGVAFLLTFDEWLTIWQQSGHLHERGCRKGQYVMARLGDNGPYAVGNVKIVTCNINNAEKIFTPSYCAKISKSNTGKVRSAETREKIRRLMTGLTIPLEVRQKISRANTGMIHSSATRAQMSASHSGRKLSVEHRRRISEGHKARAAAIQRGE